MREIHGLRNSVGVRELRHNLSVYLRRVKTGETLSVTERGEKVALLTPLPTDTDPVKQLIAEGRVTQIPQEKLSELGPPTLKSNIDARVLLERERGDRP